MVRNRVSRIVMMVVAAMVFVTVFGYVVMRLWNWLMPALFGWHWISFWQALGVLVLSRILFGGFHGHRGGHRQWRRRMMERWDRMSPEERERFRECARGRKASGPIADVPSPGTPK